MRWWLITWPISVAWNSSGTAWCLRAPWPLPPILPPRTLTPSPLFPLPWAGSCPCSFTWPMPPCSEIVLVLVKLYTYMFGSIHNHGQHLSGIQHIVWFVIWDVWNSSLVSQVLFSPDCQLINLSNVPRDSYMVFMVLGSWLILTIEQTIVHVITYTMKWCLHVLERTTITLRINNQFRSTRSIHLEIALNVG